MAFILAIDYDGTLFKGVYHSDYGDPVMEVIEKAKEFKKHGAEIALWTCREGKVLNEAVQRCKEYGLEFDAINDNTHSEVKYMKKMGKLGIKLATRKIFADVYVDDRSPGSIEYFLKIDVKRTCDNFKSRSKKNLLFGKVVLY